LQFPGYDVSMRLPPTVLEGKLSVERLKDYVAGHDVRGDFVFPDGRTTEIKYSVVPYQGCKPRSDLRVWADIRGREAASTSSTSTDERLGEARRQQSR